MFSEEKKDYYKDGIEEPKDNIMIRFLESMFVILYWVKGVKGTKEF